METTDSTFAALLRSLCENLHGVHCLNIMSRFTKVDGFQENLNLMLTFC